MAFLRRLIKIALFTSNTLLFILGLALVALAAYFFGFNLLRQPLSGNDALNALTYASWINEYFPRVPLWYPLAGGGISFVLGYPTLHAFSVVILHRLASLDLTSSLAVLNFASILLPAWGIFAFVFFRFRSRLAALLAGFFYLLSPMTYVLISGAGFLAHAYSAIFAVPLLFFYDCFLTSILKRKSRSVKLSSLFGAGIFFILSFLAHPATALGFLVVFGLYSLLYGFLSQGWSGLLRGAAAVSLTAVVFFALTFFWNHPLSQYTAFAGRDMAPSAPGDTSTFPPVELSGVLGITGWTQEHQYPFPNLSIVPLVWIFALLGTVLAVFKKQPKFIALGLIAFFSIYQTGTYTIFTLFQHVSPFLANFLYNRFYYFPTIILLPIAGALGAVALARLPFQIAFFWVSRRSSIVKTFARLTTNLGSIPLVVVLVIWLGLFLNQFSGFYRPDKPWVLHYGEESGVSTKSLWNRPGPFEPCSFPPGHPKRHPYCDNPIILNQDIDIAYLLLACEKFPQDQPLPLICKGEKPVTKINRWMEWDETTQSQYPVVQEEQILTPLEAQDIQSFLTQCQRSQTPPDFGDPCFAVGKHPLAQLAPRHWPRIQLPHSQLSRLHTASFAKPEHPYHFLSQAGIRIDVTPSLGTWTKEWGIANRSSLVNAYTGQLVLNKPFQSYFIDTMYSRDLVNTPQATDELAKYFGTSSIINTGNDQTHKFKTQNWQSFPLAEGGTLWQPPFPVSLYSAEAKPLALVIGSSSRQAYNQIFRAATMGGLPFDQAILVEGRERLDSYSLAELAQFDLLILHGYTYKNRAQAFRILEDYLRQGGRVFIDTGWQYTIPDWGEKNGQTTFPKFMPISQTTWGNAGQSWSLATLNSQFAAGVDIQAFSPLAWKDKSWNLAWANKSALQAWAQPIVTIQDQVILAGGQLGQGKIIWSGMNFPAHARDSQNPHELQLLANLFSFLLEDKPPARQVPFTSYRRPDQLTVTFDQGVPLGSSFYFRESSYPFWQAKVFFDGKEQSLPILPAGPRFMLISLPQLPPGSQLTFDFNPSFSLILAALVSAVTLSFLLLALLDSLFIGGRLLGWLQTKLSPLSSLVTSSLFDRVRKLKISLAQDGDEDY